MLIGLTCTTLCRLPVLHRCWWFENLSILLMVVWKLFSILFVPNFTFNAQKSHPICVNLQQYGKISYKMKNGVISCFPQMRTNWPRPSIQKWKKRRVIESETLNSLKIVMHAVFVVSDRLLNNPNIDSIHIKTSFSATFW